MRTILTKAIARRRVEPELLDELPEYHPKAIGGRRDLVWINAIMFQVGFMVSMLRKHVSSPPRRILEIGAGDGTFMLAVADRMAGKWPNVELVLLDRADLITSKVRGDFNELGWQVETATADVFDWIAHEDGRRFDLITANLFLHHFDDDDLVRLFCGLKRLAPILVATEPCRAAFPLAATSLLRLIGANEVTLHDAATSVRAAFSGTELSDLWRIGGGLPLEERRGGLFTHVFAGVDTVKPAA